MRKLKFYQLSVCMSQFNHPLPYEDGISEDIYHNLFVQVGLDESLQQSFFQKRCESLSAEDALAYDSTTISVYSENQNDARFGFNKAHDGLKTIKLLTLYSIDSRQPIAFTKQPSSFTLRYKYPLRILAQR